MLLDQQFVIAALTSDLKTANTLLAMQRSKYEELQGKFDTLLATHRILEAESEKMRNDLKVSVL